MKLNVWRLYLLLFVSVKTFSGCNKAAASQMAVIYGCKDSNAVNYNPAATKDDGSCIYNNATSDALANLYPNDAGIEKDPNVLYVEKFDDGMANILSRYHDIKNREGMSLDKDVPEGSQSPYAIKITNTGGKNDGGHLLKQFTPGFDSTIYMRYYVKYPLISKGYIHP